MTVLTVAPTLADRARQIADQSAEWLHRVRLDPSGRWYERFHADDDHEIWIICWLPGQATGFHDHGGSAGAFAVALGTLEEFSIGGDASVRSWNLETGDHHGFGENYIHDVRNTSSAPAISVHVYSPPLSTMNRYDLTPSGELIVLATEDQEDW